MTLTGICGLNDRLMMTLNDRLMMPLSLNDRLMMPLSLNDRLMMTLDLSPRRSSTYSVLQIITLLLALWQRVYHPAAACQP